MPANLVSGLVSGCVRVSLCRRVGYMCMCLLGVRVLVLIWGMCACVYVGEVCLLWGSLQIHVGIVQRRWLCVSLGGRLVIPIVSALPAASRR